MLIYFQVLIFNDKFGFNNVFDAIKQGAISWLQLDIKNAKW